MSPTGDRWKVLAGDLLARPGVSRSTMMGYPCLRLDGDFFASWDPGEGRLVVKLDAATVSARVAAGTGEPFAPNGRTFREWLAVPDVAGDAVLHRLLEDAFEHATARRQAPRPRRRR